MRKKLHILILFSINTELNTNIIIILSYKNLEKKRENKIHNFPTITITDITNEMIIKIIHIDYIN